MSLQVLKEVTLYKNHSGKIGWWRIQAVVAIDPLGRSGAAELTITHAKTLTGAYVQSSVPVVGKNIGRANETTPAQQAVLELDSRVNKQLDKGYVRTQAEAQLPATNTLGLLKPMLAQPIDKVRDDAIDWSTAWGQPKLDGHRCLFSGMLYSRGGKEIVMPHIFEAVHDLGLHKLHLDGELYVHGLLLQEIGSLVKRLQEGSAQLEYHLYDQISPAPYAERLEEIQSLIGNADGPIKVVPTTALRGPEALDKLHAHHLKHKFEGTIVRHGTGGYESDKRSQSLIKVKDYGDDEFEVIGFEEGTPRTLPDGRVLRVPVWVCSNPAGLDEESKTFKVTAGGDMLEKHVQWELRFDYIGKLLTVKHFGWSKLRVPLQPVALRWREDL